MKETKENNYGFPHHIQVQLVHIEQLVYGPYSLNHNNQICDGDEEPIDAQTIVKLLNRLHVQTNYNI